MIEESQVRVINQNGEDLGVMSTQDALAEARKLSLDLVEIAPNSNPPVCKILDFSRYRYEMKKKIQNNKKKQKKTSLKEMKFKVNIGVGDFDIKVKKIKGFLEDGDKVKVSLSFKGREIVHKDKGFEIFNKIVTDLADSAKIDSPAKMESRQIIMILSPAKQK